MKTTERAQEFATAMLIVLTSIPAGRVVSTAEVLAVADSSALARKDRISRETIRMAYWSLVDRGNLIRTPEGVIRSEVFIGG